MLRVRRELAQKRVGRHECWYKQRVATQQVAKKLPSGVVWLHRPNAFVILISLSRATGLQLFTILFFSSLLFLFFLLLLLFFLALPLRAVPYCCCCCCCCWWCFFLLLKSFGRFPVPLAPFLVVPFPLWLIRVQRKRCCHHASQGCQRQEQRTTCSSRNPCARHSI